MTSTLLLADDSVTIQRVIELTFADEDVRVVAVSDGAAAIELLDKSPPDIVLADADMPGRNGYEVARHIRDTPRLAHIPVLLLKGAFEPIDESKASALGCDGVLEKPFEPQLVINKVKELLSRSASKRVQPIEESKGVDLAHWPETPAEPVPQPTAPAKVVSAKAASTKGEPEPAKSAEFDTYFDRIDAALDDTPVKGRGRPAEGKPSRAAAPPEASAPAADPVVVAPPPPAVPGPAFPPLGEAFAALLAAEQGAIDPPAPATWPVGPVAGLSATRAAAIPDDIVEQVTKRVLAHMSDRVVRETVSDLVTRLAERLVREEIARLKTAVPKRPEGVKG